MEDPSKEELKWPLGLVLLIYMLLFALYNHC
jgi:hypothetical protein